MDGKKFENSRKKANFFLSIIDKNIANYYIKYNEPQILESNDEYYILDLKKFTDFTIQNLLFKNSFIQINEEEIKNEIEKFILKDFYYFFIENPVILNAKFKQANKIFFKRNSNDFLLDIIKSGSTQKKIIWQIFNDFINVTFNKFNFLFKDLGFYPFIDFDIFKSKDILFNIKQGKFLFFNFEKIIFIPEKLFLENFKKINNINEILFIKKQERFLYINWLLNNYYRPDMYREINFLSKDKIIQLKNILSKKEYRGLKLPKWFEYNEKIYIKNDNEFFNLNKKLFKDILKKLLKEKNILKENFKIFDKLIHYYTIEEASDLIPNLNYPLPFTKNKIFAPELLLIKS